MFSVTSVAPPPPGCLVVSRLNPRARFSRRRAWLATLVLLAAAGPAGAQNQTGTTWIGNGGNWGNANNWDCILGTPLCLPNNGLSDTWRVFIDGAQLCNLDLSVTIDQIDMFPGTVLNQFNGRTLTIVGVLDPLDPLRPTGVLSLDDATYMMSSTGGNTDLVFTGPFIIGTGGLPGMVQMSNRTTNRIFAAIAGKPLLIGINITIEGAGQIGVNRTSITNQGTIRATQTVPLVLDPGPGGFTNELFLLADGGTLQLNAGAFDNTGGAISAVSAGSTLLLNGATISGGIVESQFGTFQLNGGTIQNATLLIQTAGLVSASTTVGDVTILSLGVINHNNGVSGLHVSGTFENQGSYFLNSTGGNTDLILEDDTTLTGGGEIDLSGFTTNRIYSSAGDRRLTNVNNTIHGAGQIGFNRLALTNSGIIEADENGVQLTIDMAGDASVNSGVFRASGGGALRVSTDTFDQSLGGLVQALDGSLVELSNPTMIGGTFDTAGTGVVRVIAGGTRLDGAANTGLIEIPNNITGLHLLTSLSNSGAIEMLSSGGNTDLICDSDVALDGGGTISMSNSVNNRIYAGPSALTLTNVDNTIRGSGQIGFNRTIIVNQDSIIADQPAASLRVDPSPSVGTANSGLMQAGAGGTLELNGGDYDNALGQIRALTGSTVRLNSGAVVTGGTIVAEAGATLQFNGGRTTGAVPVIQAGASGPITAGGGGADGGLDNFAQMDMTNNANFGIALTFNNVGTLAMNSAGGNTDLILDGDTTLTGGGEIDLSAFTTNRIFGTAGTERLTNVNNRIHGAGQIGANRTALTNSGTIEADENGVLLAIDIVGAASINSGVFRASGGGTLRVSTDTFDQTLGGLVEALDGSVVELSSPTMIGGTFGTAGTGVIRVIAASTRLDAVANTGLIEIPNSAGLRLLNSLANSGMINMLSSVNNTDLVCETDVLLTGGGTINLSDNLANRIYATTGTLTFTNVDNTIRGSGQLGFNRTTIVNQGAIIADQSTRLQIDPGTGGLDNQGSLRAENGAELRLDAGPFTTSANVSCAVDSTIFRNATDFVQTAGSTMIDGSLNLSAAGVVALSGGILGGSGAVNAAVDNAAGSVAPGASAGTLAINGDYTQGIAGNFAVELTGTGAGQFDVLSVAGGVNLGGSIAISAIDGFVPSVGDSFIVLTTGSPPIVGAFATVNTAGLPAGLGATVEINPANVVVRITSCPGDINGDGIVDLADLAILLSNFGSSPATPGDGDIDNDGDVDLADLAVLLSRFGTTCP